MGMNVNGIGKQPCYERTNGVGKNQKNYGGSFSKSLSENLNGRTEHDTVREENMASAASVLNAPYSYRNRIPAVGAQENGKVDAVGRHMTYQESDYAKVCAAQGFSLMAQVDMDSRRVYVDQKLEDGTVKGYEIEIDKLDPGTEDPIEQMALEAWEKKVSGEEKEGEELTVEEALRQFYDFIEDRIKNGPPKYMIGNSEFSVEEWDKLLEDFDDQLDAIREEMRERIEKMKEQQQLAEVSGELQSKREEVREAEEEKTEEELLTALFK